MPLVDDLKMPLTDDEHDRRAVLGLLAGGAFGAMAAGTGVTAIRFLWPEVLFEQDTRFVLGTLDTIAVGTVLVLPQQRAYVVRTDAGVFAMTATCTHLGCLTRYEKDQNRIFCPCHGSRFNTSGEVTNGPAPTPLPRLELTMEGDILVLDIARVVSNDALLRL